MKKVNFNQLKNVKTPENWIENAINIPDKKNNAPFYFRPRFIATAASVVLCCALSLLIFTNIGSDLSAFPVAKPTDSVNIPSTQGEYKGEAPTDSQDNQNGVSEQLQGSTDTIFGNLFENGTVLIGQPVTEPKENGSGTFPTKNPSQGTTQQNPQKPTSGTTIKPTTATSGDPTAPPVTEPTEAPTTATPPRVDPTLPTDEPYFPTGSTDVEMTEENLSSTQGWWGEPDYVQPIIYLDMTDNVCFDISNTVYCHLMSCKSGETYSSYFSDDEVCTIRRLIGKTMLVYDAGKMLNRAIPAGYYHIYFYDDSGNYVRSTANLSSDICIISI